MTLHLPPRTDEQDSKGGRRGVWQWWEDYRGVSGGVRVSEHLEGRGQAEG